MAFSESKTKGKGYTYEVPKKYEMMSDRKFRLALGTAIGALIAAIILACIGLAPKTGTVVNQKGGSNSVIIKNS
jgi:hypothetical protein